MLTNNRPLTLSVSLIYAVHLCHPRSEMLHQIALYILNKVPVSCFSFSSSFSIRFRKRVELQRSEWGLSRPSLRWPRIASAETPQIHLKKRRHPQKSITRIHSVTYSTKFFFYILSFDGIIGVIAINVSNLTAPPSSCPSAST